MTDELLSEFITECREHLATIETDLLRIEEDGAAINEDLVNKVFRAAHSIKGASGFFGLNRVKELSHRAETVLDLIRSRKLAPNAEITNLLLSAFDRLRVMIDAPDASEQVEIGDLVDALTQLAQVSIPASQRSTAPAKVVLTPPGGGPPLELDAHDFERARRQGYFLYIMRYDLIHDIERSGLNVLQLFKDLESTGEVLECNLDLAAVGTLDGDLGTALPLRLIFGTIIDPDLVDAVVPLSGRHIELLHDSRTTSATAPPPSRATAPQPVPAPPPVSSPEIHPAPPTVTPESAAGKAAGGNVPASAFGEESIRVNVSILEALMNLAGELVLSRNQLRASISQNNTQALASADQRINQVTAELQDAIMQTRLQPIGNVFSKFPRVVRDLAAKLGKDIQLTVLGNEVALDKTLIEGLSDPLTHMVRNSVDHGIEMPEERQRGGKRGQGTVRIEARHEAGQVVVEVADDGKGIDPEKIAQAAIRKGLVSAEKVASMSATEKLRLLFLPGLSTAEKVSDISGRGVGMDVVKTNLDRLGGKVDIQSFAGKGSIFRIKLPLTLAIIPSLIFSVEGERFAIPQLNVRELLRVRPDKAKTRIEVIGASEVLVLRDRLIPLFRFAELIGLVPTYDDPHSRQPEVDRRQRLSDRRAARTAPQPDGDSRRQADRRFTAASDLQIAVVSNGSQTYALVVDDFHDTEEIVVKPLGRHFKLQREYAGATILGDGRLALILDVAGLAAKTGLAAMDEQAEVDHLAATEGESDIHTLLTFHNSPSENCALPLELVQRIERIEAREILTSAGRRTMHYGGHSMPLIMLADVAAAEPIDTQRELCAIVARVRGHEVGLIGTMPVDVIETAQPIDCETHRQPGIAGSLVLQEQTLLLLNLDELVDATWPEWAAEQRARQVVFGTVEAARQTVLLAEDSDFFRAQVQRFLEEDGLRVISAPDGEAAWEQLSQHRDEISAVVTDIEMPRLDGLGLTRRIRQDLDQHIATLPVIALSSLAGDQDFSRGHDAGVTDYQVKLERDELLASLHRLLGGGLSAGHLTG